MQTTSPLSSPKISCIYVNYHSARLLERSLESLFEQESYFAEKEVIIVNNDVSEETLLYKIQEKYPIKILSTQQNLGFGRAANEGARLAKGNILFFVNPDTEWIEAILEKIVNHFTHKSIGVVGIGLFSQKGVFERWNGGYFLDFWGVFFRPEVSSRGLVQEVDWVSGGALSCFRSEFLSVGGFDKRFFMYFEDMDLCFSIKKTGKKVLLDQTLKLIHLGGGSHSSPKKQKYIYDQSLYQYTSKHWHPLANGIFRIAHKIYRFYYPYGR